jgi:hypothetical protein
MATNAGFSKYESSQQCPETTMAKLGAPLLRVHAPILQCDVQESFIHTLGDCSAQDAVGMLSAHKMQLCFLLGEHQVPELGLASCSSSDRTVSATRSAFSLSCSWHS